jgi:hypothetical protein
MVDAIDFLLNNAVDLYVQAVDYHRIPVPVGARIRQIMLESGDVRQPSPDSSRTVPDFGQTGRNLAGAASYLAGSSRDLARTAESPAFWPGSWMDSAVLAEYLTSPAGILPEWQDPGQLARNLARTAGFRSTSWDPAILCRIPAKIVGIRHKWPDFGYFSRNLYVSNIKNKIYIILY